MKDTSRNVTNATTDPVEVGPGPCQVVFRSARIHFQGSREMIGDSQRCGKDRFVSRFR